MYKQEKEYVILTKDGKKIMDAGLSRYSIWDKKVRIEYFLNTLPVHDGIKMECVFRYRQKGEIATVHRWKEVLKKTNSHYSFSMITEKEIEEIVDCCLILQGNQMIAPKGILSIAEAAYSGKSKGSDIKKEIIEEKRTVWKPEYIQDLNFLKNGNEELKELYYNSFLLHGFHQYRYFLVGKDFIGVPDHFYEREAIAARMMGFPFFMEAEFMENCNLSGEVREELPKQGCFGYFLRKISVGKEEAFSPLREEKQTES